MIDRLVGEDGRHSESVALFGARFSQAAARESVQLKPGTLHLWGGRKPDATSKTLRSSQMERQLDADTRRYSLAQPAARIEAPPPHRLDGFFVQTKSRVERTNDAHAAD